MPAESSSEAGRSGCPLARALDLIGDRWTLLVVRDLMDGRCRFKDMVASPEGIPTNVLSDRLARLVGNGLARKVPAAAGSKRLAYRLTAEGAALETVIGAIRTWDRARSGAADPQASVAADPVEEPSGRSCPLPAAEPTHFADLG